jgi:deazaflavin-dependent oxidoreductase (nitroreductase family)
MPLAVPPRGTRGSDRNIPRPVMGAMVGLFHLAYRAFGDRMRVQGRPLIELETVGARSGITRRTVLGSFPGSLGRGQGEADSADAWIVVASFGGSSRHPAWFLNLARNPDRVWVSRSGRRFRVRPELLEGAERERAWQGIVALARGYASYQERTDRVIPVVRLTCEEEGV